MHRMTYRSNEFHDKRLNQAVRFSFNRCIFCLFFHWREEVWLSQPGVFLSLATRLDTKIQSAGPCLDHAGEEIRLTRILGSGSCSLRGDEIHTGLCPRQGE